MAARRLIMVMLVLLVVSSVAAALVPVERDPDAESTTTETSSEPSAPAGELVRETLPAGEREADPIRISLGDQLELRVTSKRPGQVEIPGLGVVDDVDPEAPARFDLLPLDPGDYPIRLRELGTAEAPSTRPIGSIEVSPTGNRKGSPA